MADWILLDEYSLLQVFSYLNVSDLSNASVVCKSWYMVANDDFLWKTLFLRQFEISKATLPTFSKSWKCELKRILWTLPSSELKFEPLKSPHAEEILSVSFSSDGKYFATCGRDSIVVLWDAESKFDFLIDSWPILDTKIDTYVCPICLKMSGRTRYFTIWHFPIKHRPSDV